MTDKLFTGHQLEGSLYYMKARFYDPFVGRFLSPDSIDPDYEYAQSLNRYSYVLNNPLRYTDPTGRCHTEQFPASGDPLCFDRLPEIFPDDLPPAPPPTLIAPQPPSPTSPVGTPPPPGSEECSLLECFGNAGGALVEYLRSPEGALAFCNSIPTAIFGCSVVAAANADRINELARDECTQGVAKLGTAVAVTGGAIYTGFAAYEAGYIVLTSAFAAATSGSAVGYLALGSDPGATIYNVHRFLVGGLQQTRSCFP